MKIMMITAADSIHAVRWANAFAQRGHEVVFVTLPDHREKSDSFSEKVTIHYLPFGGTKGYFFNALYLRKIYKSIKPDAVNVHYASGYGLLTRLARIEHTVLSVWGSDVYDFPQRSLLHKLIVKKNILYANRIASTSTIMAERVRRLINDPDYDIAITPFGVDTAKFNPVGNEALSKSFFWFGLVKKLTYKYGIDYVINAFSDFYSSWKAEGERGREPHLFICGKGENKAEFERLVDEKGLKDVVIIEGYIPNNMIPAYLRSIDVFCLGSQLDSESFGVSAVEAMACGVPIIATDVDGFKEVVVNEETGYIVDRKNSKEMTEKMHMLYYDRSLREILGQNGRDRVISLYEWSKNVNSLLRVIEEVSSNE